MVKLFEDLKLNLLNLIILLVGLCLIYHLLNFINKDNYYNATPEPVTDLNIIGTNANGYSIQSVQSQKYLTHSTDNSEKPIYLMLLN